jgi:hypothetical protein
MEEMPRSAMAACHGERLPVKIYSRADGLQRLDRLPDPRYSFLAVREFLHLQVARDAVPPPGGVEAKPPI